jgi:hypothetical protein
LRWGAERRSRSAVADVEEEKPEPDLDELLEQFREPEEKPRRKAVPGSAWLMMALLLGLGGVWLAFLVVTGGPVEKTLGPPLLPTKVSDRTLREEPEVDVVEDYLARCKKGMTAQEVRWIVEDFEKAGLGEGPGSLAGEINAVFQPPADLWKQVEDETFSLAPKTSALLERKGLKLARLQQKWYAAALADGLRLTRKQREELRESGARFLAQRGNDFMKLQDAARVHRGYAELPGNTVFHTLGGDFGTELLFPLTRLLEPSYWLMNEECAPWEMVRLTESQLEVTRHTEVSEVTLRIDEDEVNDLYPSWMDFLFTRSPEEDEIDVPDGIVQVAAVFPFVHEQHFPENDDDLLAVAKVMHPAQLKILLLVRPDMATELEGALEKSNE